MRYEFQDPDPRAPTGYTPFPIPGHADSIEEAAAWVFATRGYGVVLIRERNPSFMGEVPWQVIHAPDTLTKPTPLYTDPKTGGSKGIKQERLSLVPIQFLSELGRVCGFGAKKYSPGNWLKGYSWSLSIDALYRHIACFVSGTTKDEESGIHHLVHAAWHCMVLFTFSTFGRGTDDRQFVQTSDGGLREIDIHPPQG